MSKEKTEAADAPETKKSSGAVLSLGPNTKCLIHLGNGMHVGPGKPLAVTADALARLRDTVGFRKMEAARVIILT